MITVIPKIGENVNARGERCINGGFHADTVEDFNKAVRMCIAEVHGTDAIKIVTHISHEKVKTVGGICQFAPAFQDTIVVDMSKLTEVEQKRVAKIVKSVSRLNPCNVVDAQ